MTFINLKQPPLRLDAFEKRSVRTQFAALCYRVHKNETQILLITSRASRRWIIPKGWPVEGATPAEAATTEAYEEAGVKGQTSNICLGFFSYTKFISKGESLPCAVSVFPVKVKKLLDDYPEVKERRRKWFDQKRAASLVREPELKKIIKHFDPALIER
ncbi:MAG: NUDIX hydrolase [Litoreibacter sp.]|nr:NUDIX hydrolase [Litoreibacter sp.]